MASPTPTDCYRWEAKLPLEPAAPASEVVASASLAEDRGVSSPTYASLSRTPFTVVVTFSAPVDRGSFDIRIATLGNCLYRPADVDQRLTWNSDREARLLVERIGPAAAAYGLTLGRGRDPLGREVREPRFQFEFATGGRERDVLVAIDSRDGKTHDLAVVADGLAPVSVSPDGRYALLAREPFANTSDTWPHRVPYVLEVATGRLTAFARTSMLETRWDVAGGWVWPNGWTRLALDGSGRADDFRGRLPAASGVVVDAEVSPDDRWLAAMRAPEPAGISGQADLLLVDLRDGTARNAGRYGYQSALMAAYYFGMLEWTADSRHVLATSYLGLPHPERYFRAEHWRVDPLTLARNRLPIPTEPTGPLELSPAGGHLTAPGQGVLRLDGSRVLEESAFWPRPAWSPDDRYAVFGTEDHRFEVVDLRTLARRSVPAPAAASGYAPILGVSGDGASVYSVTRRVTP